MTPAAKLQDYLRQRTEATGGQYRGVEWKRRDGCPDCYCWWPGGISAWFEVKAGGDRLRPAQIREIDRMRADGIEVFLVRSTDDVDFLVDELLRTEAV